ncbi:cyclic di-GMP phosphodiesterase Gmr [Motilibacter peucedani]|uniref:Cyclic di-GMP phosphodiesterase Gmr n=1 Tax=Motilibacter peucedani TaxID=598650 RepID=A0A420XMD4_9ACTN|nr:sensor domain-containing diguanylate cyclase [Motilibacter peucedani]RKS71430.1 cyclic di-GMP phosphodiesterase Gmr [Motilibacter peucedani]
MGDATAQLPHQRSAHAEDCLDAAALQGAGALILVLDAAGLVVRANRAFLASLGCAESDALGRPAWELLDSEDDRHEAARVIEQTLANGTPGARETAFLAPDGHRRRVAWSDSPLRGPDGELRHLVCVGIDVTDARQAEARLRRLAETDALTGLLNRPSFEAALLDALDASGGMGAGLLFCDLDGFKAVNDTYGHAAGDALLVEVAERVRGLVRSHDVVARLGGDEFVVLCLGAGRPEVKALATRVEAAVRRPFVVAGRQLRVGVSVGTAVGTPGDVPEQVLSAADAQMYAVKAARRSRGAGLVATA